MPEGRRTSNSVASPLRPEGLRTSNSATSPRRTETPTPPAHCTEVAPVLPAVRALCSRSAARLRYLSYSAPKPQAPRKRRCASPRAHCNGGSAGAAHPQPEKQSGLRGEGEGRERGRREGREKEEEREKAEGKGREGAGEEGGGEEEERGEGKEGAGSERPTAQGLGESDKYIESL